MHGRASRHSTQYLDYLTQRPHPRPPPSPKPHASPAQNRLAALRRFPAVPIFSSVKLNRSAVSLGTTPSSYLRTSTLNPQQFQLYEACTVSYCTIPEFVAFKSNPIFPAT